jgi:hypothetical protein
MKKFIFCLVLGLAFMAVPAFCDTAVSVTINGEAIDFESAVPVVEDGTTLVPAKAVFSKLGYNVAWDAENKAIKMTKEDSVIYIQVGSDYFVTNNKKYHLTVPAKVENNSVMLPLRVISEATGCVVNWNEETKTIDIINESMPVEEFLSNIEYYMSVQVIMENLQSKVLYENNRLQQSMSMGDSVEMIDSIDGIIDGQEKTIKYLNDIQAPEVCKDYGTGVMNYVSHELNFSRQFKNLVSNEKETDEAEIEEYTKQTLVYMKEMEEQDLSVMRELSAFLHEHVYMDVLTTEEEKELVDLISDVKTINISEYENTVDRSLLDNENYTEYASQIRDYITAVKTDYEKLAVPEIDEEAGVFLNYSLICLEKYADTLDEYANGEIDKDEFVTMAMVNACTYLKIQAFVIGDDAETIFDGNGTDKTVASGVLA